MNQGRGIWASTLGAVLGRLWEKNWVFGTKWIWHRKVGRWLDTSGDGTVVGTLPRLPVFRETTGKTQLTGRLFSDQMGSVIVGASGGAVGGLDGNGPAPPRQTGCF